MKRQSVWMIGLTALLMALAIIVLVVIAVLPRRDSTGNTTLPTLAALNADTPIPSATVIEPSATAPEINAAPSETPQPASPIPPTETQPARATASDTTVPSTSTWTLTPTATASATLNNVVQVTLTEPPPVRVTEPLGTLPPPQVVIVPGTGTTPPNLPTATPVSTLPPIGGAAPIGQAVNIGTGQFRVVQAPRPGDAVIRALGGSIPNAPPGQEWVLVEMLLICSGTGNCTPDAASLQAQGTSGSRYSPAEQFVLDPLFGPENFIGGQVWGYRGFLIPRSEAQLILVVTVNRQSYNFALQ